MPDARVELQIVEGDVSEGIGPHTVKGDRRTKDFCNWRCAAIWCASRRGPWSLRIREVTEALDG